MMQYKFHPNAAIAIAIVLGEAVSMLFYFRQFPWVDSFMIGDRNLLPAVLCNTVIACIIKVVIENFWALKTVEEIVTFSAGCGVLYMALEAPHVPHDAGIFSRFLLHVTHKLVLVLAITWALVYFKNY